MNIERALKLKPGDTVHCPADRGDPAYFGTVTHNINKGSMINKTLEGSEYIWVEVKGPSHKTVWPSNRLG